MNLREVANEIGITEAALSMLRQHEMWPDSVPRKTPPRGYSAAHAATIAAWRSTQLRENRAAPDDPDAPGDLKNVRQRKDLEAMLLTRVRRQILNGEYVKKRLHVAAMERITDVFVAKLNQAEQSIPLRAASLTSEQRGDLERVIAETFAAMRSEIAERGRIEVSHADDAAAIAEEPKRGRGRPSRGSGKIEPTRKRKGKA